jgi:hypothetical protein
MTTFLLAPFFPHVNEWRREKEWKKLLLVASWVRVQRSVIDSAAADIPSRALLCLPRRTQAAETARTGIPA